MLSHVCIALVVSLLCISEVSARKINAHVTQQRDRA